MRKTMFYIILLLITLLLFLLTKLVLIKKTIREINEQLTEKLSDDTNTPICISSTDQDMRFLASKLNDNLSTLRAERLRYNQGDIELKNTITNISHDLRTPITAIYGYLDFLKEEDKTKKAEEYIDIISGRTKALKQLTDELLEYSSAIALQPHLTLESTNINHILEESLLSYYAIIEEHGITPNINITSHKIVRLVDKAALSRVYANLINNAIKYSKGDLIVTLYEDGTTEFSNHTDSIEQLQIDKIFNRYYTAENSTHSTGLGLSIAKALVTQMNGSIYAKYKNDVLSIIIKL